MAGSAESIWMATVEFSRANCSKMIIQFQGARQMLLSWCSLLAYFSLRGMISGNPGHPSLPEYLTSRLYPGVSVQFLDRGGLQLLHASAAVLRQHRTLYNILNPIHLIYGSMYWYIPVSSALYATIVLATITYSDSDQYIPV